MEAYRSLEFISWVNSKFSRHKAYYFERVSIIDPSQLSNTQESPNINNQEASNTVTVIKSSGPLSLFKELCKQHWVVLVLITLVKINIDFVWFLNTFTIQGNQSGDNSVFYNGMILGIASYTAFLTCGMVMRCFNFYKLQIGHGLACVLIAIYKLVCHYCKDQFSADTLKVTGTISLMMSYFVTFSLDQTFNCYLQTNLRLIPGHLQFLAIECQLAISFCFLQIVPYVTLMPDPVKQYVILVLNLMALTCFIVIYTKAK